MKFDTFLQLITKIQNIELPFLESHLKMAPYERKKELKSIDFYTLTYKESAVLILFYKKNDETFFVLTERNEYVGVHSKQISLPGGKKEIFDFDLKHTAARETFEEIGVNIDTSKIFTSLSPVYVPPSNFMIFPYLAIEKQPILFNPNFREVKNIIEVRLTDILKPNIVKYQDMTTSYSKLTKVPYYEINGNVVWGATAMILSELIDVLKTLLKQ